jgi:hypothetical protein
LMGGGVGRGEREVDSGEGGDVGAVSALNMWRRKSA